MMHDLLVTHETRPMLLPMRRGDLTRHGTRTQL